jgi:hypothetical protein
LHEEFKMNELTQKYRAKNGVAEFEIFAEYDGRLFGCVLHFKEWRPSSWHKSGKSQYMEFWDIEEIPATPEHDLKVDDLVWVWDHIDDYKNKKLRYFARFANDGGLVGWSDGATSITANGNSLNWGKHWEKYQPEPVQATESATPKWHEYVADGYKVLCKYWDEDKDGGSTGLIRNIIDDGNEYKFAFICKWKNAEPILTQCGKYCTGVKDGKTTLLLLE